MKDTPRSYVLGWSHSRYSTFEQCERRYFHEYYPGFDLHFREKVYELRQLTSVPLEIGSIFHKVCEQLLKRLQKSVAPIDHRKLADFVLSTTHKECAEKNFMEVYYKERSAIDLAAEIAEPVQNAVVNLLNSPRFDWLLNQPPGGKDEWHIEHSTEGYYGLCEIDGLKAYCKVDFTFPFGDHLVILDWKTGKPDRKKYRGQMKAYVLWAIYHHNRPLENIVPVLAYVLPEYAEEIIELTEYDILQYTELVHTQTEKLHSYCSDVDRNFPLPKESFKMTDEYRLCGHCKYREMCDRA